MADAAAATAAGASTGTGAAAIAAKPALTMKLFIDTKAKRVLFAEAGNDAVDFLFSILVTPFGSVAKLLREDGAQAPGLSNLYDSVKKMDPAYMKSSGVQDALLNSHRYTLLQHLRVPRSLVTTVPAPSTSVHGSTPKSAPSMPLSSVYTTKHVAPTSIVRVSHLPTTTVPAPSTFMPGPTPAFMHGPTPMYAPPLPLSSAYTTNYMAPTSLTAARGCTSCGAAGGVSTGGFVQSLVTYTVMDDLTIAPMSDVSIMALVNKINGEYKNLVIEEKVVQIGVQEGKAILKASLQSNTVLTDVFLSKDTTEVSTSNNKRARDDKIPDYYV